MVFCIRKVKNANLLVTAMLTIHEIMTQGDQQPSMYLRLVLEQFLGEARDSRRCHCQQLK